MSSQAQSKKLLLIGLVWPEPKSSGAGTRMMQLITLFKTQGWNITFASAASETEFSEDLSEMEISKVIIQLNDASFDSFVKELNPTIVLFDRFITEEQFGWRVAEQCPEAIRILDTEDLHCLRLARQKAYKEKRDFELADLFSDTAKREIASILRSDLSLMISEDEMNLLQSYFKVDRALIYYLPFLEEPIDMSMVEKWPTYEEREDFAFIGNFLHEPNWNTVQFLKSTVWPLLRKKLPKVNLKIYGAYPSQKVLQLHNPNENFHIMGRADDAKEVIQKARVVLAPIPFGAGAKGKLIEAMQCGTPSVTTTVGAESMQGNLPWSGTVADEINEIVQAAENLYIDRNSWQQAQKNGIQIINERYSKVLFENDFINQIIEIHKNLYHHRQSNFFGALLMHHTTASTKFMSRWIEAKNFK